MRLTSARRIATVGIATVAAVVLAAAPASAHFCFKTEVNERAAQGMAGSSNWVRFDVLAAEITGLCPAGIEILAEAGGVTTDTLINGHGLMAGGTLRKADGGGNKAISHLDFEGIDAAFPEAAAACE
jgi:hypothetical protein